MVVLPLEWALARCGENFLFLGTGTMLSAEMLRFTWSPYGGAGICTLLLLLGSETGTGEAMDYQCSGITRAGSRASFPL